jgi:glycine/D-amino acid oxidase-like deaminating enzyme/nitrite reductase/ring-hydroxylating ferredoxin subunit
MNLPGPHGRVLVVPLLDKCFFMINRDGSCISLWQDNINEYTPINHPEANKIYDVIIVGGGITGINTALLLQTSGKRCIVLEGHNIGFGTTGGTTAHLNTLLDTPYTTISKNFGKESAKQVAEAVKQAIELIKSNISKYGIDCSFSDADAYLFAQDEKQEKELQEICEATNEAGVKANWSDYLPIPVPFVKAIKVPGQGKFNPLQYVFGLAAAFEKAGGVIVQHCKVSGVEDNEVVEAETDHGIFKGRNLIYATHIPPGVNLLHLRCVPYRSYVIATTLRNNEYPQDLAYDMVDPYHYYRAQEVNGTTYLIAGGKDHKTAHEENTDKSFRELEAQVLKHFPVENIEYRWSSQYFEPADGLPYIGHLPGHPQHIFVATGFGGNGMVYSHVAAMTLKEILLDEEEKYTSLFNPNRIKPVAGFANFIKHNADVVKQFSGKWFSHEDIKELAELAPGEGKVVTYNKQKIGLFKHETGALYAVNPICTHLKCEVKWNVAERTWDCPCHGARYSYDGTVITGPADHDLEQISLKVLHEEHKE